MSTEKNDKKVPQDELSELVYKYTTEDGGRDLYVFSGQLYGLQERNAADRLIDVILEKQDRKEHASLFLTTYGGNPDDAFRIARCLRKRYTTFRLLVGGPCKSAGTLIALGATEIRFGPTGELGPVDVQMNKPDEPFSAGSGLDIFTALQILTEQAFDRFEDYMTEISSSSAGSVSFRTASEVSVKLIDGLLNPIAAHIDPVRLGEAQRAINIARTYGHCLGLDNLKDGALQRLIELYPSHSFVIDLDQARELFKNVGELQGHEIAIAQQMRALIRYPRLKDAIGLDASVTFPRKKPEKEGGIDEQPEAGRGETDSAAHGGRVEGETPPAKDRQRPVPRKRDAPPKGNGPGGPPIVDEGGGQSSQIRQ